jgi:hypothetical protein
MRRCCARRSHGVVPGGDRESRSVPPSHFWMMGKGRFRRELIVNKRLSEKSASGGPGLGPREGPKTARS